MAGSPKLESLQRSGWHDDIVAGLISYAMTTLPVVFGVLFSVSFLGRTGNPEDPISACVRFDAGHQLDIIRNGYSYHECERSVTAFFPGYPLACQGLIAATAMHPDEAALLVSNVFLIGAFVMLARWTRFRWPEATANQRFFVLMVFGLWPMSLYFRMPYAESLFLFSTLGLTYGFSRSWPLVLLASLAGLATAVRPVGLAATLAFIVYILM